jgi:glyoxylase-like metal-dependent hydrolase (beta-lactamase superfamily II)
VRFRRIGPEVWIGTSQPWTTTCTIVGPDGALILDGPVGPADTAALSARANARELIATHADWDHLLAPLAFPTARRRAAPTTIARMDAERMAIGNEMAAWDAARGIAARALPDWGEADELPSEGPVETSGGRVEIVPAPGHTRDGIAVLLVGHGVLVAGDYLSPAEIPSVDPHAGIGAYLATLARIDAAMHTVDWIIPGHGWPLTRGRAREVLAADRAYLERIAATGDAPLPRHRGDVLHRRQHERNRATARD